MKILDAELNHLRKLWKSEKGYYLKLTSIFLVGILLFSILLLITERRPESDDMVFQLQIQPYPDLLSWLDFRYHTWSGRLIPDTFVYFFSQAPLILWKIVSLILYVIFSGTIFLYYKLFSKKQPPRKDYLMLGLALILPVLMSAGAYVDGVLWVSGSMNYFWIAAFGLVGLYPLVYWINKKEPANLPITLIGLFLTVVAASSHEQVGAVFIGLALGCFGYALFNKDFRDKPRKVLYPLLFLVVAGISFALNLTAPGNKLRLDAETLRWLPDLYSVPVLERINYSARWLIDTVVNQSAFLMGLSIVLLLVLFMKKQKKDMLDYIFSTLLAVFALLLFTKGLESVSYWFTFYPVWASPDITLISYIPLVFWVFALTLVVISPLILYRKEKIGFLISVLYGAFVASIAIVTLSPTMYASGPRVLYIPSLVLFFICYVLFEKVFEKQIKAFFILFAGTALFFLSQYLLIILKVTY